MRKWLFIALVVLLSGCGLLTRPEPTPTPTPRPTVTPTPEPRYYPTVDSSTSQELRYRVLEPKDYYHEFIAPDGATLRYFSLMVVSSGKTGVIQAGSFTLDILWVYERNRIVTQYPLVVGVKEGENYVPYFMGYGGSPDRGTYLDFLQENGILERGRKIFPFISGNYISRTGIDWEACGEDVFCRLGRYMQDTYKRDYKVINRVMGWEAIPEGWALAWMWDAATDENALPEDQKINLP